MYQLARLTRNNNTVKAENNKLDRPFIAITSFAAYPVDDFVLF
jgi:hypothetical protein